MLLISSYLPSKEVFSHNFIQMAPVTLARAQRFIMNAI